MLGMDLRAEPIVLTVPPIEKDRYFSIQLIDLYTFNFDYIGSRATGNDGGSFLIAGPGWKGEAPKGVAKVIRSETQLLLAIYRTHLFNPGDLENVKRVQAGYKRSPSPLFLESLRRSPAPAIEFIKPLTPGAAEEDRSMFSRSSVSYFASARRIRPRRAALWCDSPRLESARGIPSTKPSSARGEDRH